MNRILEYLKKYGWNDRVLTRDDFDVICLDEGVTSLETDTLKWDCTFILQDGVPVILLSRHLYRSARLGVGFHCIGHWLWAKFNNTKSANISCNLINTSHVQCLDQTDSECLSHIISSCAVLPRRVIETKSIQQVREQYEYCEVLLELRYAVRDKFNI